MIRELVARVTSTRGAHSAPEEDVLLSAEVDGVTCLLTRPKLSEPAREGKAASVSLSPREREIARLVAKGYPDKVIATLLEISRHTVGTHLRRMYQKLQVPSRAALIATVVGNGLLDPGLDD